MTPVLIELAKWTIALIVGVAARSLEKRWLIKKGLLKSKTDNKDNSDLRN